MMTGYRMMKQYNIVKVVGIVLGAVLILWCVFGIKANASERAENDRSRYQAQESRFIKEVRNCLEEHGYYNSGITMTKIMNDNSRDYTVRIHHAYINMDSEQSVEKVYELLDEVTLEDENVTVNYIIF